MAARKKAKKKKVKRSRTGSAHSNSGDAWKGAERRLAKYFGVERVGLGRKGHDLSEAPEIGDVLRLRAPDLVDDGAIEPFTHICADSKCDKQALVTLEHWHAHVLANPDKKYLIPLGILGAPIAMDDGDGPYVMAMVKLQDFPFAYRALLAPQWSFEDTMAQILHRFHIWRRPKAPIEFIMSAFKQVEEASEVWAASQRKKYQVKPLPLVYLYYPKHLSDAICFKFPARS